MMGWSVCDVMECVMGWSVGDGIWTSHTIV